MSLHIFAVLMLGGGGTAAPLGPQFNASASALELCAGASLVDASSSWAWSTGVSPSPSCTSPGVQNIGRMCSDDPTSIVMHTHGKEGCFVTRMSDCKFDMRSFKQMDFELRIADCYGTWAAPLWLTPDYWAGGGMSGEIDMVELCPTHHVYSNFAGASSSEGTQVRWRSADPNSFDGHVSMWKDKGDDGKYHVKVKMCSADQAAANAGSCHKSGAAVYNDIYGSNACTNGHDCIFEFVSDIWNGVHGDDGFTGCRQGSAPSTSDCRFSIRNIHVQGPSFSGKCAALSGGSSPRRRSSAAVEMQV